MKNQAKTAANAETTDKIWQEPYVDVFKHFYVLPSKFGESVKKQG